MELISSFNTIVNLTTYLLIGLITGLIVYFFDSGKIKEGMISTIFLGAMGGTVGGAFGDLIFNDNLGLSLKSILLATTAGFAVSFLHRIIFIPIRIKNIKFDLNITKKKQTNWNPYEYVVHSDIRRTNKKTSLPDDIYDFKKYLNEKTNKLL